MLTLIQVSYTDDPILQKIPKETFREVFAKAQSVGFSEWNETGKRGMRPQWKMTIFPFDYEGELLAEYQGAKYRVYRTYQASEDALEIYLEERSGDVK